MHIYIQYRHMYALLYIIILKMLVALLSLVISSRSPAYACIVCWKLSSGKIQNYIACIFFTSGHGFGCVKKTHRKISCPKKIAKGLSFKKIFKSNHNQSCYKLSQNCLSVTYTTCGIEY